jgi:hypothetical protein
VAPSRLPDAEPGVPTVALDQVVQTVPAAAREEHISEAPMIATLNNAVLEKALFFIMPNPRERRVRTKVWHRSILGCEY